ncbi:MAG: hypothetical protein KDC80_07210 [Saprospiraceae bacterium]|nr:hypothetical protein [Saprospiraceae bacterium]
MQNKELDRLFRDKLIQANPPDFNYRHWEEARTLLKKEKRRRKYFYWFLSLMLILGLVAGGSYYWRTMDKQEPVPQDQELIKRSDLAETSIKRVKPEDMIEPGAKTDDVRDRPESFGKATRLKSGITRELTDHSQPLKLPTQREYIIGETPPMDMIVDEDLTPETQRLILTAENQRNSRGLEMVPFISTRSFALIQSREISPGGGKYLLDENFRFKRNRIAWSASLLLDPAFSSTSPARGLIVGITYEKYLATHWLIGARPSIQLRSGEGGFSKFEQFTTYGFSASNTTYGLKASNLQFFSVPIYFAAEFKKHSLEMGASVDILLSARGQLHQVAVEDGSISNIQSLDEGWISTDHMQKISTNLFMGYKNLLSSRLKTGVTLFYNPTKIYPGLPNSQNQQLNSSWYLGWQVLYYIK